MSYDKFAQVPTYMRLRRNFKDIQRVLKRKLDFLEQQGFDPDNGYLFGFSFGANMVLAAAKDFGAKKIKEIDGKINDCGRLCPKTMYFLSFFCFH